MPFLILILGALVLFLVFSGVYIFCVACVRKAEPEWLSEEALKKTALNKYYTMISNADHWLKDHYAKEICITSTDGLTLWGLWIPVENARGTVLLSHGYRSTYLIDFGLAFEQYHKMGMNILVPSQRAHGKSEGKYITFGVRESDDMEQWVRFHNDNFGEFPIILCGMSMGASTVLYMADRTLPDNVKGIIADCGFTSPWDIISYVYRRVIHLPAFLPVFVTDIVARLVAGFSLRQCNSEKSLSSSRLPVLLIHGLADGFVPFNMSQKGYDACSSAKEILLVEGADHGLSFVYAKERYISCVEKLFNSVL